jgi:hypothetical protein
VTLLGALLVVSGGAGAGWAFRVATSRQRPIDLLGALLAPVFVICMLVGGVLCFVPDFLR